MLWSNLVLGQKLWKSMRKKKKNELCPPPPPRQTSMRALVLPCMGFLNLKQYSLSKSF